MAGAPKGVQHQRQSQSNDLLQDLLSQGRNAIKNKGGMLSPQDYLTGLILFVRKEIKSVIPSGLVTQA
jgi:hypothetical protein